MEGKAASKWWSLCCGSLKGCGLSVSLYTFLFCECVCVCASVCTQLLPCLLCGRQATMNTTGASIAGWEEEPNSLWLSDNIIFSSLAWQRHLHSQVQSESEPTERRCCVSASELIQFYRSGIWNMEIPPSPNTRAHNISHQKPPKAKMIQCWNITQSGCSLNPSSSMFVFKPPSDSEHHRATLVNLCPPLDMRRSLMQTDQSRVCTSKTRSV